MLTKRIIPCLLLKDGRMVKGKQFKDFRDTGNPITAARVYTAQKVDELLFIDIEGSTKENIKILQIIEKVAEEVFMPFCIGGGIKNVADIRNLLNAGADKVSICSAAVEDPEFISEAVRIFGSQCIVVCIDYKMEGNKYVVYTHSGENRTEWEVEPFVKHITSLNIGEILLNSIDRDGMMNGYDLELVSTVSKMVDVPVIVISGAGKLSDFKEAFKAGASAVSAASIFHFTDQSPIKANFYLRSEGMNVR
jgi:cyclase